MESGLQASLDGRKRDILNQLKDITRQSDVDAIGLLEVCGWNVDIAIARYFDADEPKSYGDVNIENSHSTSSQSTYPLSATHGSSVHRRESLIDEDSYFQSFNIQTEFSLPYTLGLRQPFPGRIILSTLLYPFYLISLILYRIIIILLLAFRFNTRRSTPTINRPGTTSLTDPTTTTNRNDTSSRASKNQIIMGINEKISSINLQIFSGSYNSAYDQAKKNLKFLMLILYTIKSDEGLNQFIDSTFLSENGREFFRQNKENLIVWLGNVADPSDDEARKLARTLRCQTFPQITFIVQTTTTGTMSIVAHVKGSLHLESVSNKSQVAINAYIERLENFRRNKREQEAARSLREQQDSAYEKSLARDCERARLKKLAEENEAKEKQLAEQAQQRELAYARNLQAWKTNRINRMKRENNLGTNHTQQKNLIQLNIRLANGDRIIGKFPQSASLEEVYAFVECYDMINQAAQEADEKIDHDFVHEYKFQLASAMPREVYYADDKLGSLGEKIKVSMNLFVEETDDE